MSRPATLIAAAALLVASVSCADEVSLPRNIRPCQHDSPDYSSCLRLAVQEGWLTFVKGIPELELPPLDPMVVDYMENDYELGEVIGKFVLRDVKSYGMAKTKFLAVRPYRTKDRLNLEIDLEIPRVFVDGNYKGEGNISQFKVGGKGYFNISMEAVSVTWGIEGRIENDRWIVEHFHQLPEVGKMQVYFDDFFNGNQELNRAAMSFVNEYWPIMYKGMLPTVEKHWDYHLTDFVNRMIFSKVSFSKVFP